MHRHNYNKHNSILYRLQKTDRKRKESIYSINDKNILANWLSDLFKYFIYRSVACQCYQGPH